jgi:hypothetical protein
VFDFAWEVVEKGRRSVGVCASRSDYGNVAFVNIEVSLWDRKILISICIKRKKNHGLKASNGKHAVETGVPPG